jgi:uncharacterized protein YjiS (DUF1127 family)
MSGIMPRTALAPSLPFPVVSKPSLVARLARGAMVLAAAVRREIQVRRDMRTLASLGEAGLRDIGLSQGGIEHAVRHGRLPDGLAAGLGPCHASFAAQFPLSWTEWR